MATIHVRGPPVSAHHHCLTYTASWALTGLLGVVLRVMYNMLRTCCHKVVTQSRYLTALSVESFPRPSFSSGVHVPSVATEPWLRLPVAAAAEYWLICRRTRALRRHCHVPLSLRSFFCCNAPRLQVPVDSAGGTEPRARSSVRCPRESNRRCTTSCRVLFCTTFASCVSRLCRYCLTYKLHVCRMEEVQSLRCWTEKPVVIGVECACASWPNSCFKGFQDRHVLPKAPRRIGHYVVSQAGC